MRSSCLWFYMFGVERFSFLPDLQRDGGDLARQRQPGHFRSYALGLQSQRVQSIEFPVERLGPLPQAWSSELREVRFPEIRSEQLSAVNSDGLRSEHRP